MCKNPTDRGLQQMFPIHPQCMLQFTRQSPLPSDPTQHHAVISGQLCCSPHPREKHPKHTAAGPVIQLQSRSLSFGSRYQVHSGTTVGLKYSVCFSQTAQSADEQKLNSSEFQIRQAVPPTSTTSLKPNDPTYQSCRLISCQSWHLQFYIVSNY